MSRIIGNTVGTPLNPKKIAEIVDTANALKGQASGATVGLSDVSPIEHTLKVKLEAPEGIDVQNVKLKTSGKNFFDPKPITDFSCSTVEADGTILLTNPNGSIVNSGTKIYVNSKEPVTLSYEYKTESSSVTAGLRFRAHYKEISNEPYIGAVGKENYTKVFFCSEDKSQDGAGAGQHKGYTLEYFYVECGSVNTTWIRNLQLEFGSQTEYEPYNEAEYMPNADGTVDGVKSISPNMVLRTETEGVTIDAEYNRDLNKAYQELLQQVAALTTAAAVE